jgi:hypothetical protein
MTDKIPIDDLLWRLNIADLCDQTEGSSSDMRPFLVVRIRNAEIRIYPNDHSPPHFHVKVNEHEAVYLIATLERRDGSLPRYIEKAVVDWASQNQAVLTRVWQKLRPAIAYATNGRGAGAEP